MAKLKQFGMHQEIHGEVQADGALLLLIPKGLVEELGVRDGVKVYAAPTGKVLQVSFEKPRLALPMMLDGEFVPISEL